MRAKEAVTKVNMKTVRDAGDASRLKPCFAARICCLKYQLELPAEEATSYQKYPKKYKVHMISAF